MKSVLLALAVVLACVVYEIDRGNRLWADGPATGPATDGQAGEIARAWVPRGSAYGDGPVSRTPREATGSVRAAGRAEREHSIRLFGPGISRARQIRV